MLCQMMLPTRKRSSDERLRNEGILVQQRGRSNPPRVLMTMMTIFRRRRMKRPDARRPRDNELPGLQRRLKPPRPLLPLLLSLALLNPRLLAFLLLLHALHRLLLLLLLLLQRLPTHLFHLLHLFPLLLPPLCHNQHPSLRLVQLPRRLLLPARTIVALLTFLLPWPMALFQIALN